MPIPEPSDSDSTSRAVVRSRSPEETFALGEMLGQALQPGTVVGLVGPLGAGKTQFVKGAATGNAAGGPVDVTSPTFTLIHTYPGRVELHHVDCYRLHDPEAELDALGLADLLEGECAVLVEWADRVRALLPETTLWITFTPTGPTERTLRFEGRSPAAADLIAHLRSSGC
ncbi:MAG: tRNA (adenosine(37)-N6)-threonylcarbamoyltransferase complex ATPase subunit type 1 TsaE [Planctomycetota bacterium]|nr:MAG: tRNA (adenosine(37)-N6)-threonylcarbamoyltransferase complex ATPase subunit type 1 TsaE [Planctomycetota bacterium]